MLPAISPQEAFERFSKGEVRLVDIRETNEYAQEFVPGSRLIPLSIIARHPLKDADARTSHPSSSAIRATVPPTLPICWNASPGRCKPTSLMAASPAGGRRGLPVEHISSTIPLFRQIQIAAGSLVLIGVIGSAFWHSVFWLSALSVRGSSSPEFPGSAASACCFRACRGTGVEPGRLKATALIQQ